MKQILFLLLLLSQIGAAAQVSVKVHSVSGYDEYEPFAREAAEMVAKVFNSDEFKEFVRHGVFTKTDHLNNEAILELIFKAHEIEGEGGTDGVLDLRLRTMSLEKDGKSWMRNCAETGKGATIGKDGLGDGVFATCPQVIKYWKDNNQVYELAGHFAHEYMHILGFGHRGLGKARTLVYSVGSKVSQIGARL